MPEVHLGGPNVHTRRESSPQQGPREVELEVFRRLALWIDHVRVFDGELVASLPERESERVVHPPVELGDLVQGIADGRCRRQEQIPCLVGPYGQELRDM